MEQKNLILSEGCINKNAFHNNKRPINIDELDIRRIMLFSKHSYGIKDSLKYFIGYINIGNIFPLHYA